MQLNNKIAIVVPPLIATIFVSATVFAVGHICELPIWINGGLVGAAAFVVLAASRADIRSWREKLQTNYDRMAKDSQAKKEQFDKAVDFIIYLTKKKEVEQLLRNRH